MVIGIPRAYLYHRYRVLWETFFEALDIKTVVSRPTDKEILNRGMLYSIDEACLSSKIYMGHVDSLIGKCDAIFVPRISNFGDREILCTKFEALYDIVGNTFRDMKPKIIELNIDVKESEGERAAFMKLGKRLGKKKAQVFQAYLLAKQAERMEAAEEAAEIETVLMSPGMKILLVGHSYNLNDAYIGRHILTYLESQNVIPVVAEKVNKKQAMEKSEELTDTMPWRYNKELVGAVHLCKDKVDGIILVTAFPCGPDSLTNEVLLRRVKNVPILQLILDSQEGTAGMETRLESFIDIIKYKREASHA